MSNKDQAQGVDFHCHLDLYPDFEAAIAKAEKARIYTLTVTTTPKAWKRNHQLTRDTRYVRAALGIHPQLVAERESEIQLWEHHLSETRYVGEVGLDAGPRFYKSMEAQKRVFRRVLEKCANAGGKILSVHSVRSAPTVLKMIEQSLPRERGTVVLHWFTGSKSDARRAVELGCYFSVNAEMLRSDRGRSLVKALPIDRILTETDGPFTNTHGITSEPLDVLSTAQEIASLRELTADDVIRKVHINLLKMLC